jgi:hypothetical protein
MNWPYLTMVFNEEALDTLYLLSFCAHDGIAVWRQLPPNKTGDSLGNCTYDC